MQQFKRFLENFQSIAIALQQQEFVQKGLQTEIAACQLDVDRSQTEWDKVAQQQRQLSRETGQIFKVTQDNVKSYHIQNVKPKLDIIEDRYQEHQVSLKALDKIKKLFENLDIGDTYQQLVDTSNKQKQINLDQKTAQEDAIQSIKLLQNYVQKQKQEKLSQRIDDGQAEIKNQANNLRRMEDQINYRLKAEIEQLETDIEESQNVCNRRINQLEDYIKRSMQTVETKIEDNLRALKDQNKSIPMDMQLKAQFPKLEDFYNVYVATEQLSTYGEKQQKMSSTVQSLSTKQENKSQEIDALYKRIIELETKLKSTFNGTIVQDENSHQRYSNKRNDTLKGQPQDSKFIAKSSKQHYSISEQGSIRSGKKKQRYDPSSSSESNLESSTSCSSSISSKRVASKSKRRRKQTSNVQRILGEFKCERYNGVGDPKTWFKQFENKAELHYLFDRGNEKRLLNELYFAVQDKVREYMDEKRLLKEPYKVARKMICNWFAKNTYKANQRVMLIKQKENEIISDFFYRLKRYAKDNGVHDNLVRDTLLNNLNMYGLQNYVESLQLQLENEIEYSSYDIKDKLLSYIERHRLSDRSTRKPIQLAQRQRGKFIQSKDGGKNFSKGVQKNRRVHMLARDNEEKDLNDEESQLENQVHLQDDEQQETSSITSQNESIQDDNLGSINNIQVGTLLKNYTKPLIEQHDSEQQQAQSEAQTNSVLNLQKKHIKNGKQLFDSLSKMVQEGKRIPLADVAKHNRYNIMNIPWVQLLNEAPIQMLHHVDQLGEIVNSSSNLYNSKEIVEAYSEFSSLVHQKYVNTFKGHEYQKNSEQAQQENSINTIQKFKAKEHEDLQYIQAKINGLPTTCMLDTGAQVSAISKSLIQGNLSLESKCVSTKEEVYTMDGQPTIVQQKLIAATIRLSDDTEVESDLYVTNSNWYKILLGRNVINAVNGYSTTQGFYFLNDHFVPALKQCHNVIICNVIQEKESKKISKTIKQSASKVTQHITQLSEIFPYFPIQEKFTLIYIDPPFNYGVNSKYCKPPYKTLTDSQLQLFGKYIQSCTAIDCVLLMWVTNPKLQVGLDLIRRWGFIYRTKFIEWIKMDNNKEVINPGKYSSNCIESLLIASKGNINKYVRDNVVKQVMYEPRKKHSEKPMLTYSKINEKFKLYDMHCIEIFARQIPPFPFAAYGDQLPQLYMSKNVQQQQSLEYLSSIQHVVKQVQNLQIYALNKDELDSRVRIILETISNKSLRDIIQPLIIDYIDVFAFNKSEVGQTPLLECNIKLQPGTIPISKKPYRLSKPEADYLRKEIDNLLKLGFIEPCQPQWALPVILVPKGKNDYRMCIDFRSLNKHTISEIWVLQRIDTIFSSLQGYKFFSKLDGKSGYYHMLINKNDRDKTAFICMYGCYRWVRMPFGLKNAPYYFCRLMDKVLGKYVGRFVYIYIDDIVVYSRSKEEHLKHLQLVFQALRDADIKLGYDKCEIFQTEIQLLGHRVRYNMIEPLQSRVEAILKISIPINPTQLRSFLGLCSYYRQYINNFAQISKPLYELTQDKVKYVWDVAQQQAFDKLKELLSSKPFLSLPRDDCTFILQTDYSGLGLGAILSQRMSNGQELVVEYASRCLRGAEKRYIPYEGEILAIHWSLSKFRHFLLGRMFELYTDNKSLQLVLEKEKISQKIIRWLVDISDYEFKAMHRLGTQNQNADALSRLPIKDTKISKQQYLSELPNEQVQQHLKQVLEKAKAQIHSVASDPQVFLFPDIADITCKSCNQPKSTDENPILICDMCATGYHLLCVHLDNIPQYFWYCSTCKEKIFDKVTKHEPLDITCDFQVLDFLQNKSISYENKSNEMRVQRRASRYTLRDGKLWVYTSNGERIVPSLSERFLIMTEKHEQLCHGGVTSLLNLIQQDFYWPFMKQDILIFVKNCIDCRKLKPTYTPHQEYFPTEKGNKPFYTICIDLATNLPKTKRNNKHIIIAIDSFSKWVEIQPIPDKASKNIAQWFYREVICRHGSPQSVRTDRGTEFLGDLNILLNILNIPIFKISMGYSQSNELVERYVNTIKQMLMRLINTQPLDWDISIPTICLALRASVQSATKMTPYEIVYGHKMNVPTSVINKSIEIHDQPSNSQIVQYANTLKGLQNEVHQKVFKQLKEVDKKRKINYKNREKGSKSKSKKDLQENDQVFVRKMRSTALESPTAGPFLFMNYTDERKVACRIKNPITNRVTTVSTSNIVSTQTEIPESEIFLYEQE